jgi:hypothetical protein
VPGLENCFQLKTIEDAKNIRRRIIGAPPEYSPSTPAPNYPNSIDNFEAASSPVCTDEERRKLLSFVICGGGPTGVGCLSGYWCALDLLTNLIFDSLGRDCCGESLLNLIPNSLRSVWDHAGNLRPLSRRHPQIRKTACHSVFRCC